MFDKTKGSSFFPLLAQNDKIKTINIYSPFMHPIGQNLVFIIHTINVCYVMVRDEGTGRNKFYLSSCE